MSAEPGQPLRVRRAKHKDLAAIASLVREAAPAGAGIGEPEILDWLFSKGLWVAGDGGAVLGVAAWQAENLVAVTDVFYTSPSHPLALAGGPLLEKTEAEAVLLMCEANVMVLPEWTPEPLRGFLQEQGYEAVLCEELHPIWREVLREFLTGKQDLMVKRLRERMVMVPL
jgi:N-acetylglutamate synthase-like GNAT family acetyltransferase